jgi:diguanylate cyclase
MRIRRLLPILDVNKEPDALLRLFVKTAMVSMVVIMTLAGYGFHEAFRRYVISEAEQDAISVSRALLAEESDQLIVFRNDGRFHLEVKADDIPRLDRQIRRFLTPFGIIKIKIYTNDYRIAYSTDTKIIGEVNGRNFRLKRALAGSYDSEFETKDKVRDLADEVRLDVDFVETYIPIRDKSKRVIGSFEVYLDVTKYRDQSRRTVTMALGILAATMGFVFGLSFFLIRKGTRNIKEIQEQLKTQAITDSLTGTFNKRQILVTAHKEFSRAYRRRAKGLPEYDLGFVMIDIDWFKKVNDTFGHLAGDQLLKELADRISGCLRAYDTLGRFGGEEFLIILPGSDLDQTKSVARKIWRLIRETPFTLEGKTVKVTVSIGVAAAQQVDMEYAQMLKRADEALYLAKSTGRDQIA